MATIELEISDDGTLAKVPEQVQRLIDKAFGQGQAKATDEAGKQLKGLQLEIAALKGGSLNPAEREKLRTLEGEQSKLREELALRDKNYEEARRIVDERHAKELQDREAKVAEKDADIARRTSRLHELAAREIRAAALAAGARKESVEELELILGSRIGLDDGLQAFVKDANSPGTPALGNDGQPVSIEGFVTQYLADHPHHRVASSGRGGGAAGGRSTSGTTGGGTEKDAAFDAARQNPTTHNLAAAFARIGQA